MPKAIRMMRVVGDEEGRGSMATETATRVVGKQWQWQQGWQARKRARSARAMAMAIKRQQRDDVMTTRRRQDDVMTPRQQRDNASA